MIGHNVRPRVIAEARAWIGTPYHHQAATKGAGCDCLGLIRGVYAEVMEREPETPPAYSRDWAEMRGEETLLDAARRHLREASRWESSEPGDVLIFRMRPAAIAKHAGIVSETAAGAPLCMIHAQESVGVAEIELSWWWRRKIVAVFSFPAGLRPPVTG